jgi:hypothetical protein
MLDRDAFKDAVREYVEIDDQIKQGARIVNDLRKRARTLAGKIIEHMQMRNISVCALDSGGKVERHARTSLAPIKREYLEEVVAEQLGDHQIAMQIVEAIWSNRATVEKHVLKIPK